MWLLRTETRITQNILALNALTPMCVCVCLVQSVHPNFIPWTSAGTLTLTHIYLFVCVDKSVNKNMLTQQAAHLETMLNLQRMCQWTQYWMQAFCSNTHTHTHTHTCSFAVSCDLLISSAASASRHSLRLHAHQYSDMNPIKTTPWKGNCHVNSIFWWPYSEQGHSRSKQ